MTDKYEFKQGDIVFLQDGQRARFVAKLDGQFPRFVVEPQDFYDDEEWLYDDEEPDELDEGEAIFSSVREVSQVFAAPPRPVIDKATTEAIERLQQIRDEISASRFELDQLERNKGDRLKKLRKMNEVLEHIEDVVLGNVTHYVAFRGGLPRIVEHDEMVKDGEGSRTAYRPRMRLLALYGISGGDISWGVSRYYDGSGSEEEVVPCLSREEAEERARSIIRRKLEEAEAAERPPWNINKLCDAAAEFGVKVSDAVLRHAFKAERRDVERHLNESRSSVARYEKKLVAIDEKYGLTDEVKVVD